MSVFRFRTPKKTDVYLARFAGDASPATLSRADTLFDETFPSIREQLYEGYGAIELMVSGLS